MMPPLLYQEVRKHKKFINIVENPKETPAVVEFTDHVNKKLKEYYSKDRYKSYFPNKSKRTFESKSLKRALSTEKDNKGDYIRAPEAEKLLARFIIFETYDAAEKKDNFLDLKTYFKIQMIDLFCQNINVLKVNYWKIGRYAYLYMNHPDIQDEYKKIRLPIDMEYHGIDEPMSFNFKHIDDRIMTGTFETSFSSNRLIPKDELWGEAFDQQLAFNSRIWLDENMFRGDFLLSGTATYNYIHPETGKSTLFTTPIILQRVNVHRGVEEEQIKVLNFHDIETEVDEASKKVSSQEANNIWNFLDRRRKFSVSGFVPSTFDGLKVSNNIEGLGRRKIYWPLKPAHYDRLKVILDGYWFSLSRIHNDVDYLSLTRYEFISNDSERNFLVKRSNYSGNSFFEGFVDRTGSHIYLVLRAKRGNRNRMIMFSIEGDESIKIKTFLGLGMSQHRGSTSWREMLIRFQKKKKIDPLFASEKDNISYKNFHDIDNKIISRENKLYLADQDQATLSFPEVNSTGSAFKFYTRQKKALPYCGRTYFVYSPYLYNSKFELFRVKLVIDDLAQATVSIFYPNDDETYVFRGWVSKVEDTLRVSVFNSERQQLQILCNINKKLPDDKIVLDGNILSTDNRGKALSDSCFIIQSDLISKELQKPGTVEKQTDQEYKDIDSIINEYLSSDMSYKGLAKHFENNKSIRHYLKVKD